MRSGLYEISHKNPIWINPIDAKRIGVHTGDLVRVETEIGYFVDKVWITEGIKPGVIAMSHHLGTLAFARRCGSQSVAHQMWSIWSIKGSGQYQLNVSQRVQQLGNRLIPDTSRIWWEEVGVHQNSNAWSSS